MAAPDSILDNPKRWQERAEEARSIAEQLSDPDRAARCSSRTSNGSTHRAVDKGSSNRALTPVLHPPVEDHS
jgi:hypothetical protein